MTSNLILHTLKHDTNFMYIIHTKDSHHVIIIDPSSGDEILHFLSSHSPPLIPTHILNTHGHWDHTAGNLDIKQKFPKLQIVASSLDMVHDISIDLTEKTQHIVLNGIGVIAHHVPCHTRGSYLFHIDNWLFTGDTIFNFGCGRMFEGSAQEMLNNIEYVKNNFEDEVLIKSGHDYAKNNLKFRKQVTGNDIEEELVGIVDKGIDMNVTLKMEKRYNIFFNKSGCFQNDSVTKNELDKFSELRRLKDNF